MPFTLNICNPSTEERQGQVCFPWQAFHEHTKIEENELVLRRGDKLLPYQIDTVDPKDPASKMLVFSAGSIPGSENFPAPISIPVTADVCEGEPNSWGDAPDLNDSNLGLDITGNGVKFRNRSLNVWFNLGPKLDREGQDWYAGAATSVQLHGTELLDAFIDDPAFHDIEKRCMQLNFVELFRPSWEPRHYWDLPLFQKQDLFNQPYHVVSSSSAGPVRVSVTIASDPFDYSYRDPFTRETRHLECRVFRIISLYAFAEHLVEELFVKGIPQNGIAEQDYVHLYFVAHYFSYLSFLDLNISWFDFVPDWFVASNLLMPFQAYGFATDRHIAPIEHPHNGFPDCDREQCSFSFNLLPCKVAKSLHIFMRYDVPIETKPDYEEGRHRARRHFEDRAGALWNEHILNPLWIALA